MLGIFLIYFIVKKFAELAELFMICWMTNYLNNYHFTKT